MGYYLINRDDPDKPFSQYVERIEDLIYHIKGDINDAIIVSGKKKSQPFFLRDSEEYKNLCSEKLRNGILAQEIFKKEAIKRSFMIEDIPQDQTSFISYNIIDSFTVKRADFVIKNCKDIEVDVKCLSMYTTNSIQYFYIRYHEIKKLERMNSLIDKKTVLAIFKQHSIQADEDSLKMIELSTIHKENNRSVIYDKNTKCFKIPLDLTTPGFKLLEEHRINSDLYFGKNS